LQIGDLVKVRGDSSVGLVIKVNHPEVKTPDYRTPTAVLVFYGKARSTRLSDKAHEHWYDKNELEVFHAPR